MQARVVTYTAYQFNFEKLDVYQKAIAFTNDVFTTTLALRKEVQYSLGEQFRRAALSICNNLAEGSDKATRNAKKQLYGYALDSARECIPMITLAHLQRQIDEAVKDEFRNRCLHICNMLSRLIRAV
ncbi:MAG: four helix bundle protein [Candidatus Omnitrophica bacterium]|nr:four helix bundle protein [Candidatus Omnitrophota bacterium]